MDKETEESLKKVIVIDKSHKYHSSGDYELVRLVSYKAADSNDVDVRTYVRHKFNSISNIIYCIIWKYCCIIWYYLHLFVFKSKL